MYFQILNTSTLEKKNTFFSLPLSLRKDFPRKSPRRTIIYNAAYRVSVDIKYIARFFHLINSYLPAVFYTHFNLLRVAGIFLPL